MIPRLQRMFVRGAVVLSIVASVAMGQIPLVFLPGSGGQMSASAMKQTPVDK